MIKLSNFIGDTSEQLRQALVLSARTGEFIVGAGMGMSLPKPVHVVIDFNVSREWGYLGMGDRFSGADVTIEARIPPNAGSVNVEGLWLEHLTLPNLRLLATNASAHLNQWVLTKVQCRSSLGHGFFIQGNVFRGQVVHCSSIAAAKDGFRVQNLPGAANASAITLDHYVAHRCGGVGVHLAPGENGASWFNDLWWDGGYAELCGREGLVFANGITGVVNVGFENNNLAAPAGTLGLAEIRGANYFMFQGVRTHTQQGRSQYGIDYTAINNASLYACERSLAPPGDTTYGPHKTAMRLRAGPSGPRLVKNFAPKRGFETTEVQFDTGFPVGNYTLY